MTRWAMVIDLRKCIGCGTCRDVCERSNGVPRGSTWRRIIEQEETRKGKTERFFLSMGCMHCEDPPCLKACPTGATFKRGDGIVGIDQELCLGCGACIVACPYQARSISHEDRIAEQRIGEQAEGDRIGTCTKCHLCAPLLDQGLKLGLRPDIHPEAMPRCAYYCLTGAIVFGDLQDQASEVSKLIKENRTIQLQKHLKTEPAVYYIL